MRFLRFQQGGTTAYGVLEDDLIHEISGSMYGDFTKTGRTHKMEDVKLLTPCEPTKIICIGLNYMDHINELGFDVPERPANFMKPLSSVINPYENIVIPKVAERVDYEGEVAVIIKNRIKEVTVEEARQHILGITAFNDVTERMITANPRFVTYGKGFDTFSTFGPFIETEVDLHDITMRTYLNGEKMQEGYTGDAIFSMESIVSYFSQCMTLFPGDIISTGTSRGVQELRQGDKIEVEINGPDFRLVNYVVDARK